MHSGLKKALPMTGCQLCLKGHHVCKRQSGEDKAYQDREQRTGIGKSWLLHLLSLVSWERNHVLETQGSRGIRVLGLCVAATAVSNRLFLCGSESKGRCCSSQDLVLY